MKRRSRNEVIRHYRDDDGRLTIREGDVDIAEVERTGRRWAWRAIDRAIEGVADSLAECREQVAEYWWSGRVMKG